jgi:hypothetical protein
MSIGPGLIGGEETDELVGIRPGDDGYVTHSGAVFHPQDENNTDTNITFYEIQNTGDQIDFTVQEYVERMRSPLLVLYSVFGETDFEVEARTPGETVIAEASGFSTNTWVADISATDGQLRLTQFDTGGSADGTQAAWYPYVGVFDRQ